jgi:hypothetical protein
MQRSRNGRSLGRAGVGFQKDSRMTPRCSHRKRHGSRSSGDWKGCVIELHDIMGRTILRGADACRFRFSIQSTALVRRGFNGCRQCLLTQPDRITFAVRCCGKYPLSEVRLHKISLLVWWKRCPGFIQDGLHNLDSLRIVTRVCCCHVFLPTLPTFPPACQNVISVSTALGWVYFKTSFWQRACAATTMFATRRSCALSSSRYRAARCPGGWRYRMRPCISLHGVKFKCGHPQVPSDSRNPLAV